MRARSVTECLQAHNVSRPDRSHPEPESDRDARPLDQSPRAPRRASDGSSARVRLAPFPDPPVRVRARRLVRRRTRPRLVPLKTGRGAPRVARERLGAFTVAPDLVDTSSNQSRPRLPIGRGARNGSGELAERLQRRPRDQVARRARPRRDAARDGRVARHYAVRFPRISSLEPTALLHPSLTTLLLVHSFWSEVLIRRSALEFGKDVYEVTGGVAAAQQAGAQPQP